MSTMASSSLSNFSLFSSAHEQYFVLFFSLVIAYEGGGTSQTSSDKKSFPQYPESSAVSNQFSFKAT